ncbi:MAG: S-layer homology domain-containing protein [bacterium]|nr:S-layer homology domain-containing protein [bacterium]MDE0289832.1 S-layer homology domain-containing protein [bacterium]MDE0438038.1 S-layer homology domain-containing protein [bacterium]
MTRGRLLWVGAVSVLMVLVAAAVVAAESDSFDDDGGVHEPSINRLAAAGILEGTECGERLICPDEPLERWVMAVWMTRVLDQTPETTDAETRFADVDPDAWWVSYVERLADLGVTAGCKTDPLRYCPDKAVTRAQMATFLVRALDLDAAPSAGFTDTAGNTHEANIDALAAAGVTAGCRTDPLRYCPDKAVTRAQMATFLVRALDLMPEPATVPDNPGDTRNCGDFATQAEAQEWFDTYYPHYGDVAQLDRDNDGQVCESLP